MSETISSEETTPIQQEIPMITWAETRPYWEKYIWKKCLQNNTLTESELDTAYNYLKMELGLIPDIEKEDVDFSGLVPPEDEALPKVFINGLQNISNVNAIPDGQSIGFNKQLTMGWGINGSGKSGYGRIMANACFSRGERIIHPNLRNNNASNEPASVDFIIEDEEGSTASISFTDKVTHNDTLKRFAVFDSKCVNIQLNDTNTIQFVPGQLSVFDLVNENIHRVEEKLKTEQASKKKVNPFETSFGDTVSPVSGSLLNMDATITDENILTISTFPEDGDQQIKVLSEKQVALIKLDVPKKKKDLEGEQQTLTNYSQEWNTLLENFSTERIGTINSIIKDVVDKKALVQKLGVQNFDDGIFKSIGTDKWKALLTTAKELYDAEQLLTDGAEIGHCLLCHQQLSQKEKTLFDNYWLFLKDTASTELASASKNLGEWKDYIQQVRLQLPKTDDDQPAIKLLLAPAPDLITQLQAGSIKIGDILTSWETQIQELKSVSNVGVPELNLTLLDNLVASKKKEAEVLKDPTEEIEALKKQIIELQHRKTAHGLQDRLKEYAAWLKWFDKAGKARFPKGTYTGQRTIFFNQIVTEEYTTIFNEESKKLNGEFGLKIESSGSSGETYVKLKLDFSSGTKPTDVLSEGEQKVCALADFLSEIRLNKNNCGMIFDDPVTSLDHISKDRIAARLVEESKNRQVIILTHDITFLLSLQYYAQQLEVESMTTTIRRVGDSTGIAEPELPWIAQPVSKRKRVLRTKLQDINAMINAHSPGPEVEEKVKIWYELLREAWERAVEERLLKGTIERFRPSIETNRLRRLVVTNEQRNEVINAMTESSKWVHDRAASLNVAIPDGIEMDSHLTRFENFISTCEA